MHIDPALEAAWAVLGLGLGADADRDQVTRAYRRLARATHPDVSPRADAAARFAAVANAFRRAVEATRSGTGPSSADEPVRAPASATTAKPEFVTEAVGTMPRPWVLGGPPPGYLRQRSSAPIVAGPVQVHPMGDPSWLARPGPAAWGGTTAWSVWPATGTWLGGGR